MSCSSNVTWYLYRCWERCVRTGPHLKVPCQQTSGPYCRRLLSTSLPPIVSGHSAETTSSCSVSNLQLLSRPKLINCNSFMLIHYFLHTSQISNMSFLLLFPSCSSREVCGSTVLRLYTKMDTSYQEFTLPYRSVVSCARLTTRPCHLFPCSPAISDSKAVFSSL